MFRGAFMEKIYSRYCGVDVHKKLLLVCFVQGRRHEVREFGTSTKCLVELAEWLIEGKCEMIAMESTGSYWKPLYNVLEVNGLKAMVVNAHDMKAVPGRKTDVNDAEWIADLVGHGLLKASFIPDKAQRELRELLTYRKSLVSDKARELNRLQKMLEGGNIKLSGTVRDINGVSSRNLLTVLLSGKKITEDVLIEMHEQKQIAGQLKASYAQLAEDLEGVLTPLQCRMIRELLKHVDELEEHIANLDNEIDDNMNQAQKDAVKALDTIPGIAKDCAKAIVSVVGTCMERFPTAAHFCSWAGICPGNNESAGKRKTGRTRKGNNLLKSTLVICAHSAVRVKRSYFYAQFQRISTHRGKKRAYVAVAHSMLTAVYYMLKNKDEFKDLGSDYYSKFNPERKIKSLLKKLRELGCTAEDAASVFQPVA